MTTKKLKVVFHDSVPLSWQAELRPLVMDRIVRDCQELNLALDRIDVGCYPGGMNIGGQYCPPRTVVRIVCHATRGGMKKNFFAAKTALDAWCIEAVTIVPSPPLKNKPHRPGLR